MTHPLEIVSAFVIGCGVLVMAAFSWPPLPRPKPQPPVVFIEPTKDNPQATLRAEPLSKEQREIYEVRTQIQTVQRKAEKLEKLLDAEAKE